MAHIKTRIPSAFIKRISDEADLVSLVERSVKLKRSGSEYTGCCPFHNERTPSFTVSPGKGFYHCFGCGAHGDAIDFLVEHDLLSFNEAIADLAEGMGLEIPREAEIRQTTETERDLYDLISQVDDYFESALETHSQREAFHVFLQKIGVTPDIVEHYGVGMAPNSKDSLQRHFGRDKGLIKQLHKCGLMIKSSGDIYRDRFVNRLTFSVNDRRGRVVGFSSVIPGDMSAPKYLTTPDTEIFSSGREIYGFYQVRQQRRKLDTLLVTPDCLDVIMLAGKGFNNAVSPMSKTLTEEQLEKLGRLSPRIVFLLPGNEEGHKRADEIIQTLLPQTGGDKEFHFSFVPGGACVSTFIVQNGEDDLHELIENTNSLSALMTQKLSAKRRNRKQRLLTLAEPFLEKMPESPFKQLFQESLGAPERPLKLFSRKDLAKQKKELPPPVEPPKTAFQDPVSRSIAIVVQYPVTAFEFESPEKIKDSGLPKAEILHSLVAQVLDSRELPTMAMLIERSRGSDLFSLFNAAALVPLEYDEADYFAEEIQVISDKLSLKADKKAMSSTFKKPVSEMNDEEKEALRNLTRKRMVAGTRF